MPLIPFVRMSTCSSNLLSCFSAACAAVLAIALGAVCPNARAQTGTVSHPAYTYAVTDLGTLPGGTHSESYAINESGDVAGDSQTSTGGGHATLFKAGKVIDLGVLPGGSYSVSSGLNGYDEVTGSAQFPTVPYNPGSYHAFLYRSGKMQDIGTLSGDDVSGAGAINDAGQITGGSGALASPSDPFVNSHGFLYSAGTMTNLAGSYGDSIQTAGQGINSFGQVAGWVGLSGYPEQDAAVFSNGSIMPLGMLPGGYSSEAEAINDLGQVTGYSDVNFDAALHAFLYSKDKMIDLGTLPGDSDSVAYGINVAGQVVGNSLTPLTGHPFLYRHGHMLNLNSLLPAGSGWTLDSALAINDKGQITGTGTNPQGFFHAYLLSPVFQPFSTLATVADIIGTPGTTFAAGGRFVLGAKSNGIYPLAETLVLQLGGYHISIPSGSFTTQANGVYTYTGNIGSASVFAVIRPLGSNVYLFGVVAKGVAALPTSYPYNLTVTIGDDTGTQAITSNYNTSGLTEAEVCQDFGLNCK